jgi:hypothetical protein
MGLEDRDYMKWNPPPKKAPEKPSLWKRFKFWLYLLFHRKDEEKDR